MNCRGCCCCFCLSSPPSRVASSNAEVVVSATAAVTCGAARVSLSPRDQSSSGEETARGAATSNAEVAASSNIASRSSTAGLDTLALVAADMSTAASTSSTSQAVALPASKCSHPDCKFVAFEPQPCTVSGCPRTIHSFCYAFALGDPNPNSPLRCVDCIERPTNQQQLVPTTTSLQTNHQQLIVESSNLSTETSNEASTSTNTANVASKLSANDFVTAEHDRCNTTLYMSQSKMDELSIYRGDNVVVMSKTEHTFFACVALADTESSKEDINIVRIHADVVTSLGIQFDDIVTVVCVDIEYASEIRIKPRWSSDVEDDYVDNFIKPYFEDQYRPVCIGGNIIIRRGTQAIVFRVVDADRPVSVVAPGTIIRFEGGEWIHPGDKVVIDFGFDDFDLPLLKKRNRGGRPKGSTKRKKLATTLNQKRAINFVVERYAQLQKEATSNDGTNRKRASRVKTGALEELCLEAKREFKIEGNFTVPLSTIQSRIKSGKLEVYHPGSTAPLLAVEVVLKALIITAWTLNMPMSVGQCIMMMNSLISGTKYAELILDWKRQRGMLGDDNDDLSGNLVGYAWWRGMSSRNPDIVAKMGRPLSKDRHLHVNDPSFTKMLNQQERGLVQSGNAVYLPEPVHMDMEGNIVENAAEGYGRPVTIKITRPTNVFYLDETGSITHGKDDKAKGGEKAVVPEGVTAKIVVGTNNSHFTVVPVTNAAACLVAVCVIFRGRKLMSKWVNGIDVFAPGDGKITLSNFGTGRRYPGLELTCPTTGANIPVLFAASKKASMTSKILKQLFAMMDDCGITSRGVDESTGQRFYPSVIIDGHVSRMGIEFLTYVNEEQTQYHPMLGVPNGTGIWQFHDDTGQNGSFKQVLAESKRSFTMKKRRAGLSEDIKMEEIVVVLRPAIINSFLRTDYARRSLARRGCNPFNRNILDHPDILVTAPQQIQEERAEILALRGEVDSSRHAAIVPPTQRNLLQTGSGRQVSGAEVAEAAQELNFCATAGDILSMAQSAINRNEGRRANNVKSDLPSHEVLEKRYSEAGRMTSGVVFGQGDGVLGKAVRDEVIKRDLARTALLDANAAAKKRRLRKIIKEAKEVIAEMTKEKRKFKWTNGKLTKMCKYKKIPSDAALPTKKDLLLTRYHQTKNRPSPHASPCNSDDEDGMHLDSDDESFSDHHPSDADYQKWKQDNDVEDSGEESEEEEEDDDDDSDSDFEDM